MSELAQRLLEIEGRIKSRLTILGRSRDEVTLVIVTKNHPASLVLDLYDLGCRDFGENRDQEAGPKAAEVLAAVASPPTWHFVGQLQSNKAKNVIRYADVVHSVDRSSLLNALSVASATRDKPLDVFIQVNLTEDPNRGGVNPEDLERFAEATLAAPNLNLLGIMAVAGLDREPEAEFERVAKLSALVQTVSREAQFISAGMSGDFEVALDHGATHLRIGSAITGNRPK